MECEVDICIIQHFLTLNFNLPMMIVYLDHFEVCFGLQVRQLIKQSIYKESQLATDIYAIIDVSY